MLVESLAEFILVVVRELEAEFVGFLDGELEREAVGILQFEELGASEELVCPEFLEFFDTFIDGLAESVFFFGQNFENISAIWEDVVGKLGVVLGDNREDFLEEALTDAEVERAQDGAAN